MIRFANKFDNEVIVELIKDFAITSTNDMAKDPLKWSKTYIEFILNNIYAGQGFVLIDNDRTGILIAIKSQCFWLKDVYQLQEVMLHSKSPILMLRLIKEYARIARGMIKNNEVSQAVICSYKDDKFERLGMKNIETHWEIL